MGQFTWSLIAGALLLRLAGQAVLDPAASFESDHGLLERRSLSDPRVTWIRGSVTHAGYAAPFVEVIATVDPMGYAWTVDVAITKVDGTFEIPITTSDFDGPRKVWLAAEFGDLRGEITLTASPGQMIDGASFEIGPASSSAAPCSRPRAVHRCDQDRATPMCNPVAIDWNGRERRGQRFIELSERLHSVDASIEPLVIFSGRLAQHRRKVLGRMAIRRARCPS